MGQYIVPEKKFWQNHVMSKYESRIFWDWGSYLEGISQIGLLNPSVPCRHLQFFIHKDEDLVTIFLVLLKSKFQEFGGKSLIFFYLKFQIDQVDYLYLKLSFRIVTKDNEWVLGFNSVLIFFFKSFYFTYRYVIIHLVMATKFFTSKSG